MKVSIKPLVPYCHGTECRMTWRSTDSSSAIFNNGKKNWPKVRRAGTGVVSPLLKDPQGKGLCAWGSEGRGGRAGIREHWAGSQWETGVLKMHPSCPHVGALDQDPSSGAPAVWAGGPWLPSFTATGPAWEAWVTDLTVFSKSSLQGWSIVSSVGMAAFLSLFCL